MRTSIRLTVIFKYWKFKKVVGAHESDWGGFISSVVFQQLLKDTNIKKPLGNFMSLCSMDFLSIINFSKFWYSLKIVWSLETSSQGKHRWMNILLNVKNYRDHVTLIVTLKLIFKFLIVILQIVGRWKVKSPRVSSIATMESELEHRVFLYLCMFYVMWWFRS